MDNDRRSGLVLCTMDDFDDNGRLKPGYRDEDGCWVQYRSTLIGAPAWHRDLMAFVTPALDAAQERGEDFFEPRRAAVEALIEVAAALAVHNIDCIDPDGETIPGVIEAALDDFANAARVQLLGEIKSYGLD